MDSDPRDSVRVGVPGNMRSTRTNDGLPSANFFSMFFPLRNNKQIAEPEQLLAARTYYYSAMFILVLKVVRRIPGGLARIVNTDVFRMALLLINIGNISENSLLTAGMRRYSWEMLR